MPMPTWQLPLSLPPKVRGIGFGGRMDHIPPPRTYERLGFWCLHFYQWRGSVAVDGVPVPILPGHAGICPIAERLDYRFETAERHIYVHFQIDDSATRVAMPALIDCGDAFERISGQVQEAMGWPASDPARASARLWDVLWQLYRLPAASVKADGHPAVAAARHLIEMELAKPLAVADLARAVDCSHNHLIRLFHAELSTTIVAYIRTQRMERARLLLEHTAMPVRAVAAEVGIPDVAQFAKQVRRTFGKPPRDLRAQAQAQGHPAG